VRRIVLIYLLIFLIAPFVRAQELERIMDLSGGWNFSIGDNKEWSNQNFNDSKWNKIEVPGSWEEQGYHGYDGIAWYRSTFRIPSWVSDQYLYIELGYIDDVDEVFINGVKVGSTGSFPPNYKTAYNARRLYVIPKRVLDFKGENIISVRVFDEHLEGGIVGGRVQLLKEKSPMHLDIDLQGQWKFRTGDNKSWSNLSDYSDWIDIIVPGAWEDQGFNYYDGYAWYVNEITIDEKLSSESLVLVLGKIDDIDEVYINGKFIASIGEFKEHTKEIHVDNEYKAFRGYYLPLGTLMSNKKNTIAVRVYDARKQGGIYEGPIGIITQVKYINYWRTKKETD